MSEDGILRWKSNMSDEISLTTKFKAFSSAAFRTFTPVGLDRIFPGFGLGKIFELGTIYRDTCAAQNIKILLKQLKYRVDNLKKKLESIENGEIAAKIQQLIQIAANERNDEKISFCAAVIAGLLNQPEYDMISELQEEFIETIINLSGLELVLLQALYERKPDEAVSIPKKGSTWLNQKITINDTTMAWIDVLVKKGLVEDASFETKKGSKIISTSSFVKSRTVVRLSTFARSMIVYLLSVQSKD